MFRIAIICGGPSLERGISLNSARSLLDHLQSSTVEIVPLYIDHHKNFYLLSSAQLYSNTPSDFDFKLSQTATELDYCKLKTIFQNIDMVFPVIHGPFGEDGELQTLLEELGVPFVGTNSVACTQMFFKHTANDILMQNGYQTIPSALLAADERNHISQQVHDFYKQHQLQRAVVKPVAGGSSIGVFSVNTAEEAIERAHYLFDQQIDTLALLEPFCEGREFTILVLQNTQGHPVALVPTEIEINYDNGGIFDYRRKYLPTANTLYHTPCRFSDKIIQTIRQQAEDLFKLFHMRDFARLDGWLLDNGKICFTDFNPITGLEQNSFVFRQASLLGLSHRDILNYVVHSACSRYGLTPPQIITTTEKNKQSVFVLFGGKTAERQVSLMSGTNVWLKLRQSSHYLPQPYFYDQNGDIWSLPYSYTLNHTVEEIYENCLTSHSIQQAANLLTPILEQLQLHIPHNVLTQSPRKMSLAQFAKHAQSSGAYVFIAMHGGEGENGTLQQLFSENGVRFNGSDAQASALCMDKYLTGQAIANLNSKQILSLTQKPVDLNQLNSFKEHEYTHFWTQLCQDTGYQRFIIKPRQDGCSTGIVLLTQPKDLQQYVQYISKQATYIPSNTFSNQPMLIELPAISTRLFLIEPYIETDRIYIQQKNIRHDVTTGWLELTVGVLEHNGQYHALNPSITVAEGAVLSLEEKFQGGTGVNLTPPPEEIFPAHHISTIKKLIELAAQTLGIKNYARLDIFYNHQTSQMILIEANSLPGLTPSTVIYHQALAEEIPLYPCEFLESLIAG